LGVRRAGQREREEREEERQEGAAVQRSPPSAAATAFLGTRGAYSRTAAAIVSGSVFSAKRLKMRPPGPTR
ncbi:MAG: hypothetical protein ACK559_06025, partial [bacterium]